MSNKILVLGGTGKTGRRIVQRLTNLKVPHRIGSRNAEPAFDWDNPATWEGALNGISKVYISFQPDIALPHAQQAISNFVEIARKSNVRKLVLLSGRGEPESVACENIVIHSGMEWAILRCSWFMQNFSENFLLGSILENKVILPFIRVKEPFIDADDIAEVAVQVLIDKIPSNKLYELTGPELISFENAVTKIAAVSKRDISYNELPVDEYVEILRGSHIPEEFIAMIKYLLTETLDGRNEYTTEDIGNLLGRKAGNFDNYVAKTYETGIWNNV